jgi:Pectate lyase superfamily protein
VLSLVLVPAALVAQGTNIYTILNCQTTYGATGNGLTDDTSSIQRCIDAVPPTGGEVFLPAGKYLITSPLRMGNGTPVSESSRFGIHLKGVGVGAANTITVNSNEWSGGTTLLWGGDVGGTMLLISGPTLHMKVSDIQLNANGIAGTGILISHAENTVLSGVEVTNYTSLAFLLTATSAPVVYGNCDIIMNNVRAVAPATPVASGMKLDGFPGGFSTCSSKFTDIELGYGGASGSYGVQLAYADNNSFTRMTIRNGPNTGGNSIVFSPPANHHLFPYGSVFDKVYYTQPISGASGSNGNHFVDVPVSEGVAVPVLAGITSITDQGELFGPFSAVAMSSSDAVPSFVVKTPDASSNSAGVLAFQWGRYGQNYRSWIRSNYFDGLVFGTAAGANPIQDRWRILDSGHLLPWQNSAYDIGSAGFGVRNIYVSGSIFAGGLPGLTSVISIPKGYGACTITFSGGIAVASTC